ncbi:4-coumarate--CoA ligase-like 9 isoform X3 [Prunus avium]|uniref:4-coumarate--CoA ligase-like 9 isoform X3 n=1 Tax=Prunus avium TaxID=42229 RepID=A0A6P5RDE0_PRUAV|nr:4-coumarate--CoA ligase-like 9 isoform X3 [Prunus avium]
MADQTNPNHRHRINPMSGYCPQTKTFHTLRPPLPLPPLSQLLSITHFALSLLQSSAPAPTTTLLIDAESGRHVSYENFIGQVHSLTLSLQSLAPALSKGHVAFILSPTSLHVPVLYFSLLALGVVVSPANPIGSESEIAHQVRLSRPSIAFATSATAHKLPRDALRTIILLDSPEFLSMLNRVGSSDTRPDFGIEVSQTDSMAILFSSGTTGRVKGVLLTHRNFIAQLAGFHALRREPDPTLPDEQTVSLFTVPLFHVYGFFMLVLAVTTAETLVLRERFDFEAMLRAVERYKVSYMPVSPPLIVSLGKSELAQKYDLSSLRRICCGGAPLGKEVAERFTEKFPNVEIVQGYGLTEGGGVTRMIGPEESKRYASVGRLSENMEAKIVDPETREALPPGRIGELWLRGPTVMKGYIGDDKATAETLSSDGWLKTGDLCFFDDEGFLYIVDRLKELIKYKAYQVPPAELEPILQSHPDIADAAVIPYPDEEAGQIPMAYVVRKPGSNINEAAVMDFVAKQVAPYKKIRRVLFINSIPKSQAGKILRRELISHALSSRSSIS